MITNIVNHIGNRVNVWHTTGNALENRKLLTVDTFGITVTTMGNEAVFIPWIHINYVDLIQLEVPQEEKKVKPEEAINTAAEFLNDEWNGHVGITRAKAIVEKISLLLKGGHYLR